MIGVLTLLLGACFEESVVEQLTLSFLPDGRAEVTATVEIDREALESDGDGRLGRLAHEVLEGRDAWARRFSELEAESESFRWEKHEGLLTRAERTAVLADPSGLASLFGDTAVAAEYAQRDDRAELAFHPGPSLRATRAEQQRVERALEGWSEAISDYLSAAEELYRHLDAHPTRARALVLALFEDVLETETPALTESEEKLIDELSGRMEKVLDVLTDPESDDRSLEQLSRLVYDPFPARLRVEIPAEPLEVEGFWQRTEGADTVLIVPGLSFWKALESLEGRWIFPDPVLTWVWMARTEPEASRAGAALAEILSPTTRRVEPSPLPAEVLQALEERLTTEPVYWVVWTR